MKVAPLYHELAKSDWCQPRIVHTGQHYDYNMSEAFFQDLNLPAPHVHLGVGSGTHAEQTAGVMMAYEEVCLEEKPDFVIVVGDVNSTLACAITAKKLWLPVAHLEAGLRSGDRSMPEEINRILTDSISDLLWTPSPDADENLRHEGIPDNKIAFVGNIMLDSYEMLREKIEADDAVEKFKLNAGDYGLVTLHRNFNVDTFKALEALVNALLSVSENTPLIFPVHPRTRESLQKHKLWDKLNTAESISLIEPLGYIPFMRLVSNAKVVVTDSGGIQEETTYLGIPCLTLRPNTERPITITEGTNRLSTAENLVEDIHQALNETNKSITPPKFWDGQTAQRVAASLKKALEHGTA